MAFIPNDAQIGGEDLQDHILRCEGE
jgi:hypothetical protein